MSEYFNIVPWFNSKEWLEAYNYIYTSSNREEALNILLIWKARCPSLPSGIESTLSLLEVLIQDNKIGDDTANDQVLRLAYSSAIMRFVNHMLDSETAKGTSLYTAARNLGVPDWIIDLRHDTAHSNKLPSIDLLREAAQISLEWLDQNYWKKYKECISDYVSGRKDLATEENNKIAALIQFCMSLSFCAHSKCKIKNLSEIPNASMRESIVSDARDLFGDQYDYSNLKTISVTFLINLLNSHSKKILKGDDATLQVNKALLGEDSLFLSMDLVNIMNCGDYHRKMKLTPTYVQSFEILLTFLHSHDLLLGFILELIEITQQTEYEQNKRLLAALWISTILQTLGKSRKFIEKLKFTSSDIESKKKHELRSLYHHWFPNEKSKGLMFDLQKAVPAPLMNINYLQPILLRYNPYLKIFVKDLLNLVEPQIPKHVKDNIFELTEVVSSTEKCPVISSKIYTVEDLNLEEYNVDTGFEKDTTNDEDITIMSVDLEADILESTLSKAHDGIWKLPTGNFDWSSCPIGLLPWQQC